MGKYFKYLAKENQYNSPWSREQFTANITLPEAEQFTSNRIFSERKSESGEQLKKKKSKNN